MKPYKNLESQNLAFLLLIARLTVGFGFLTLLMSVVVFIKALSSSAFNIMAMGAASYVAFSLLIFFGSGVMAAIVAFEENYRKRTELLLSKSKEDI